jgi:branched-chain amino acid transport system substrate-binding protein
VSGKYKLLASIMLVTVLIAICACSSPVVQSPVEAKVLKVGSVMPFTGPASYFGLAIRPVMQIYTDLINEDGGIKIGGDKYKVELYFADGDGINPSSDASAARSLIYSNNVKAIVSYFGVGYPIVASVTTPEKVILNASTISMGTFNADKDLYSIFGFPAVEMGENQAMAVMHAFPEAKTLCWVYASGGNTDVEKIYGPIDEALEKTYGIKSVRVGYPLGTTNFTAYITRMAELGTGALFSMGTALDVGLIAKQRTQMGYKWPIGSTAAILDINIVRGMAGSEEAMQNICGDYCYPWVLKKVTVAPRYLAMANRIREAYKAKYAGKEPYVGAFGVGVTSMGHYLEACQMAGTTDPDKVMSVLRGGTLETFIGKFTLTGSETYGSPIVFGFPCAMSIIRGNESVYLNEEPLLDIDHTMAGETLKKSNK